MSKFKVGDKVFYRGNRCRVIGIQEPSYALQVEGVEGEDGRIPRADEHEIQSAPAETPYERRGRELLNRFNGHYTNRGGDCRGWSDRFREAMCDFAAELAPHELVTANTISETELAKELRKVGAGMDTKFYWECVAHKARELLCKDVVRVDFVLKRGEHGFGYNLIPKNEKAEKRLRRQFWNESDSIGCEVAALQREGFRILVR